MNGAVQTHGLSGLTSPWQSPSWVQALRLISCDACMGSLSYASEVVRGLNKQSFYGCLKWQIKLHDDKPFLNKMAWRGIHPCAKSFPWGKLDDSRPQWSGPVQGLQGAKQLQAAEKGQPQLSHSLAHPASPLGLFSVAGRLCC